MIFIKKKIIKPRKICLEASTVCQLNCPSCPTASGQTGKKLGLGFLKFNDFKNIVDRNPWVYDIELSNWGEIFLNKELIKIMRYAYKHNIALHANNGANLNNVDKDVLEALVKYRFRRLRCSIDGVNQDTYSLYRVNGNFQKVIENIKTINKFKAQFNSRYPILIWQFIAFGHNEHEISNARKMAKKLNMAFCVKLSWGDLYTKSFSPIKNVELIRKETGLGVANRDEFKEKYGKEYVFKDCCLMLWTNPQINYDGNVLGCATNYWDDYGNALKEGLSECLNNEKINYAREMLMGKQESKTGIPCTQCKIYKRLKKNKDWVTNKEIEEDHTRNRAITVIGDKILGPKLTKQLINILEPLKSRLKNNLKLKGRNVSINRVFSALMAGRTKSIPQLTSQVFPMQIPLMPDEEKGWKPYHIFRGFTTGLQDLSCHVSVLIHDNCPHSPHTHKEEELLLLLSGEVDLILPDGALNRNEWRRLKTGQFVYYPSYFAHTLQTTSEDPANYLMFKWYANSKRSASPLAFGHFNMFGPMEKQEIKDGLCSQLVFEGATDYLRKLHCHITTLAPGAGYEPHIDPYDVAIIIIKGEVETLGKRLGPHSVVFYAAGEPHGMRNYSGSIAKYVVFEFHGPETALNLSYLFFVKFTDPKRWKRKLKHILNRLSASQN